MTRDRLPPQYPSAATISAIKDAVSHLEEKIGARLNGMDSATQAFHADLTRVPTLLDRAILSLREVIECRLNGVDHEIKSLDELLSERIAKAQALGAERLSGIDAQLRERDVRHQQHSHDTTIAVDAALAAAKETTSKIEAGFTKQIDSMAGVINTKTLNLDQRLGDLKDRITALEARGIGSEKTTDRTSTVVGQLIAGAVAFVVLVTAVVGVVAFIVTRAPTPIYLPAPPNTVPK